MNKQKPFISVVALWGISGLGAILYNGGTMLTLVGVMCIIIATRYYSSGAPPLSMEVLYYCKILKQDLTKQIVSLIKEIKEKRNEYK